MKRRNLIMSLRKLNKIEKVRFKYPNERKGCHV